MKTRNRKLLVLAAACGAAAGLAGTASAQPDVVHLSGATLLENLFKARAATVDYIDVDGNGVARAFPNEGNQQLAPFILPVSAADEASEWNSTVKWAVNYSAVGSTRGFQELINFGRTFNFEPGVEVGEADNTHMRVFRRTVGYLNRNRFINGGVAYNGANGADDPLNEFPDLGLIMNANNPAGSPVRAQTTFVDWPANTTPNPNAFKAVYTSTAVESTSPNEGITVIAGYTVDMSPLDVPTTWAVTISGTPSLNANPQTTGYGNNGRLAVNRDGSATAQGNKLATLTGGANLSNTVPGVFNPAANANTIFDSSIVFAPVTPIINFGTGIESLTMTDLQHIFTTGRRSSGENLMVSTRDSGSGTRNAFDNSIGIDPSWNVGDNAGASNNAVPNDESGLSFLPSNKGGNPNVERTVQNNRLAIGYVGPERRIEQAWLTGGRLEIPDITNDIYGGTLPQRPTLDNLLNNDAEGWVIFGPGVLATFGDPKAAPESRGGLGWLEPYTDNAPANGMYDIGEAFNDRNGNLVRDAVEARPGSLNPAMRNVAAAALINNFTRSIDAFLDLPGSDQTVFTPGEYAAIQYILPAATDYSKQITPSIDPAVLVENDKLNQALQDFLIGPEFLSVYENNAFVAFGNSVAPATPGNSRAGKVPVRTNAASTYSDQAIFNNALGGPNTPGVNYVAQSGAELVEGTNLPLRNLISGDFNGDGLRNVADASDLIGAWRKRTVGAVWSAPDASGALATLATSTGQPAIGADFCIEIVGDFNSDGSYNAFDLRYWADGLAMTTGGTPVLDRKAGFTALDNALDTQTTGSDINVFNTTLATPKVYAKGDSRGDVANSTGRVARGFQPVGADGYTTVAGDANLINAVDIDYVYAQFISHATRPTTVTDGVANWSTLAEANSFDLSADIDGDLDVDQDDVSELVETILGTGMGDVNLDGVCNAADRAIVQASIATPPANPGWANGDVNGDEVVNAADLSQVSSCICPGDFDGNGATEVPDIFAFLAAWFAGDLAADYDGNGSTGVPDIFAFLAAWFAGCPA